MLHRRCLAGFELTSGSEYARDPNVLGFWKCIWFWYARVLNIPAFWICQSFEYKTGSEYNSILNIPGFWIYQGSLYISLVLTISGFWIYHGFWICQNSKYLRLLNIPGFWICIWLWIYQGFEFDLVAQGSEYVWICLNIFWIFFCILHFDQCQPIVNQHWKISINHLLLLLFFFYQRFLSRTLTSHRTAGKGMGPF